MHCILAPFTEFWPPPLHFAFLHTRWSSPVHSTPRHVCPDQPSPDLPRPGRNPIKLLELHCMCYLSNLVRNRGFRSNAPLDLNFWLPATSLAPFWAVLGLGPGGSSSIFISLGSSTRGDIVKNRALFTDFGCWSPLLEAFQGIPRAFSGQSSTLTVLSAVSTS